MNKTTVLCNKHVHQRLVIVEGSVLEEVQSYVYQGQMISLAPTDFETEINELIQAGWKSFHEHKVALNIIYL